MHTYGQLSSILRALKQYLNQLSNLMSNVSKNHVYLPKLSSSNYAFSLTHLDLYCDALLAI